MPFKKIPPINIVLFIIMLGLLTTVTVGVIKFIKSGDDPGNNYVESTYNVSLSKYYTDSLSRTPLAELGKIEIKIYDSIENMNRHFVLCRISNDQEVLSLNEVTKRALTMLLDVFPGGTYNGEFNYRIIENFSFRSITMDLHPKALERESEWPD